MELIRINLDRNLIRVKDDYNDFILDFNIKYLDRVKKILREAQERNWLSSQMQIREIASRLGIKLSDDIFSNYVVVRRIPIIYDKLLDFTKPKQYSYDNLRKLSTEDLIDMYKTEKNLAKLHEGQDNT